nr:MAG TPA: hypothetical protein [Caudoviricetes sp.]
MVERDYIGVCQKWQALFQFILGACKGSFFRCGKAGGERGIQNPGDYS